MTTATKTRHTCTICGGRVVADKATYSRFTKNRYCVDVKACQKRARRRATC